MKATLEFNLPEEQMEFNRANQSLDMACALFDILQLRKAFERHYEAIEGENLPDCYDGLHIVTNAIIDVLKKHNINIYNLIE
jgi:molecular chaperone GrpE (heat shock protein)